MSTSLRLPQKVVAVLGEGHVGLDTGHVMLVRRWRVKWRLTRAHWHLAARVPRFHETRQHLRIRNGFEIKYLQKSFLQTPYNSRHLFTVSHSHPRVASYFFSSVTVDVTRDRVEGVTCLVLQQVPHNVEGVGAEHVVFARELRRCEQEISIALSFIFCTKKHVNLLCQKQTKEFLFTVPRLLINPTRVLTPSPNDSCWLCRQRLCWISA